MGVLGRRGWSGLLHGALFSSLWVLGLGLAAFLFNRAITILLVTLMTISVLPKGLSLFCVLTTV